MRLWDGLLIVSMLGVTACSGDKDHRPHNQRGDDDDDDDDDDDNDDDDDDTTAGDDDDDTTAGDDDDDTTPGDDDDTTFDEVTVDLVGLVYEIDLANAQWNEPAGVGPILATSFDDMRIWASLVSVGGDTIEGIVAIAEVDAQDLCSPTVALPAATWSNPSFSLESATISLPVSGIGIEIEDVSTTGIFVADGSSVMQGTVRAALDTRSLGEALALGTGDNAVCELVATFGVVCTACSDGTGDYCLPLDIENIEAPLLPGVEIIERTEEDIASDPFCQ